MKFYNRKNELLLLDRIIESKVSEFVYFLWRRRIGKTSLINHFFQEKDKNYLYFFVGNKWEWNLLKAFEDTLYDFLGYAVTFQSLRDFLKFVFEYSVKNENTYIVFDEFQNFLYVNEEIFWDFQEFWDLYKDRSRLKLFAIWSIYTMMEKVFQDKTSPLFWRATAKIVLQEFDLITLKEILLDYGVFSYGNLLDIYTVFWWVPKYLEIFDKLENISSENLLENILTNHYIQDNSLYLKEWTDLLLWEFWKTSPLYFSILEAIANSKTKRSEIADYTKISYDSLGLYLDNLEKIYWYIEKMTPIIEQKTVLNRYKIKDNFLFFWFRYIYKKSNLIEIGKYKELTQFILSDRNTIKWFTFEKLVKNLIIEQNRHNKFLINFEKIGNYFDKWGNEIDLVCFNETSKQVVFIECKLNKSKLTQKVKDELTAKSLKIQKFHDYEKHSLFISLEDLWEYLG